MAYIIDNSLGKLDLRPETHDMLDFFFRKCAFVLGFPAEPRMEPSTSRSDPIVGLGLHNIGFIFEFFAFGLVLLCCVQCCTMC